MNQEFVEAIKKNYFDGDCFFVFNTEVARTRYAEWCVRNPEATGVRAVDMERFITWDSFKNRFFENRAGEGEAGKGLSVIPPLVRKFFAASLIEENSQKSFLTSLIQKKYAKNSAQFTGWISSLLPSLQLWNEKFGDYKKNHSDYVDDAEDLDYSNLHQKYAVFLTDHDFYDPLWAGKEFFPKGKKFVIFGYNLNQDFAYYEDELKKTGNQENVFLVKSGKDLLDEEGRPKKFLCYKFPDSRTELRRVLLKIRELSEKIDLSDIALVVPQIDVYRPYVERECKRYCIPCSIKSGKELTRYPGGNIFHLFKNCCDADFSYESVRALLTNSALPWNEAERPVRENLIKKGADLRCICNYSERRDGKEVKVDIWEEAFAPVGCDDELNYYRRIRTAISQICGENVKTFEQIKEGWKNFKTEFLGENPIFENEVDLVLSRCLVLLTELAQAQEKYCDKLNLTIKNPYDFFLSEIDSKVYAIQNKDKNTLSVFKYKVTACAPYKIQFVLDCSQANLDSPNKRLAFLSEKKRENLGLLEEDRRINSTQAYINSYGENSEDCYYSYAEDSFGGFAIAHNGLDVSPEKNPWSDLDSEDFNKNFAAFVGGVGEACGGDGADGIDGGIVPAVAGSGAAAASKDSVKISQEMIDSFGIWAFAKQGVFDGEKEYKVAPSLLEKINEKLKVNRSQLDGGGNASGDKEGGGKASGERKITLTQSDMKAFFPCPRKWLLKNVLKVEEDKLQTDLIGPYDMGSLNHKILELFMKDYQAKKESLPVTREDGTFAEEEKISAFVDDCIEKAFDDEEFDFMKIPLVSKNFRGDKEKFNQTIMNFLHGLCKAGYNKGDLQGFGGWTPVMVEEYPKRNATDQAGSEGLDNFSDWEYTGRFDCVLADDDRYAIIDFKNTANAMPATKKIVVQDDGKIGDFQMPIYYRNLESSIKKDAKKGQKTGQIDYAYFYAIKGDSDGKIKRRGALSVDEVEKYNSKKEDYDKDMANPRKRKKPEEPEKSSLHPDIFRSDSLLALHNYSKKFVELVKEGKFYPLEASDDIYIMPSLEDDCKQCDYNAFCRYNFTVAPEKMRKN